MSQASNDPLAPHLANTDADPTTLRPAVREILETLSEDELSFLGSIRDRLDSVGTSDHFKAQIV